MPRPVNTSFMINRILLFFICFSFIGCSDKDGLLSPEDMREDIQYYFQLIRDIHPNPYLKYDSMTFVSLETQLIQSCAAPMSLDDFQLRLLKTRKFLDGHTGSMMSFNNTRYYDFPFVEFNGDKMLLGNDTLVAVKDSFATYSALDIDSMIPWDQPPRISNEYKNRLLNMLLSPALRNTTTYTAVRKTANGLRDTTITVVRTKKNRNTAYTKPYASVFYPEKSIAVLYYNTCEIYNPNDAEQYRRFVDTFFSDLEKKDIKYLFIDVTHNSGGADRNNSVIFNHLKTDEFTGKVKMTGKKKGVEMFCNSDLFRNLDKEDEEIKAWIDNCIEPAKENGIAFSEDFIPANPSGYQGKVFVIMGNYTYSAGANFCLTGKKSKAATLVGEAAGQYYPICGNCVRGTLPNSKIWFQVPTTETSHEPASLFNDGYILPDISYPVNEDMGLNDYLEILSLNSNR